MIAPTQGNTTATSSLTLKNGGGHTSASATVAAAAPPSSHAVTPSGAPLDGPSHAPTLLPNAVGRPSVPDPPLNAGTSMNNAAIMLGVATGLAIVGILLIFGLIWLAFRLHRHHGAGARVGLHVGRLHPGGTDSSVSSDSRLKHLFAPLRHVSRRATGASGGRVEARIHNDGDRAEGAQSSGAVHRMELESEDDIARVVPWIHHKSHSSGSFPYDQSAIRFCSSHEVAPDASSEGLYPPWASYHQQHAYRPFSPPHSAASFQSTYVHTPLDHPNPGCFAGAQGSLAEPERIHGAYLPSAYVVSAPHLHGGPFAGPETVQNGTTTVQLDDTPAPTPAAVAEVIGNLVDEMPSRTLSVRNSIKTSDSETIVCSPLSLTAKRKLFDPDTESGTSQGAHVRDLRSTGAMHGLLSPPQSPEGSSHGHNAVSEGGCTMMTFTPPDRPMSTPAPGPGSFTPPASSYHYGWAPTKLCHTEWSRGADQSRPLSWEGNSARSMSHCSPPQSPPFPDCGNQYNYSQQGSMPPLSLPSGLETRQAGEAASGKITSCPPAGSTLSRRSSRTTGTVCRHQPAAATGKVELAHSLGDLREHEAEAPVGPLSHDPAAPVEN